MSDSLIIDWLNENKFRSYPMRNRGNRVTTNGKSLDSFILDANLIYTDDTMPDPIKLTDMIFTPSGMDHICTFRISGQTDFVISNVETATYPVYIRNSSGSLLVIDEDIKTVGYTTESYTDVEFEPSLCYHFNTPWKGVSSLSFNGSQAYQGYIIFNEGYQFLLNPDLNKNTITLGARGIYGVPIGCEEFFPSVEKDCPSIISTINGVTLNNNNQQFIFTPGSNIAIFADPDNHKIYVGLNFESVDICPYIKASPTPTVL